MRRWFLRILATNSINSLCERFASELQLLLPFTEGGLLDRERPIEVR
jgi:hypothetical protein